MLTFRSLRVLAALVTVISSVEAQTVYVDASAAGTNDGTSWANAYVDLQSALVSPSASIWVARGTYRPGPPGSPTTRRFELLSGTKLYGGFAGFETTPAQRDIESNRVILSGDLLGNDLPAFVNRTDNCRFVVRMTGADLDGVVVEGAYSNNGLVIEGGGIVMDGPPSLVQNCWIRDNQNGLYGGGVFCNSYASRIVACRIEGNRAWQDGGGVDLEAGGFVERCLFLNNWSLNNGGGVFNFASSRIDDCVFVGNESDAGGAIGAMYDSGVVNGCTLVGNISGGGRVVEAHGMSLRNSIVWGNTGIGVTVQQFQSSTIEGAMGTTGLDPLLADADGPDGVYGTDDDDLRLLPGSPCIDAGNNSYALPGALLDVAGLRRFSDDPDTTDTGVGTAPIVDRGAHEYRPCAPPVSFCITSPNSVGPGALMSSRGTAKLYADDLVLEADGCPPLAFGLFFHGSQAQQTPFGNGVRCVGGGVIRAGIVQVDATGHAEFAFDAAGSPVPLSPGVARHFQYWYRNVAGGGAGFNLSDGLTVRFCP